VWQVKGDGTAGEHDECECGLGGVKAVGPAGDEPDLVVECLGSALIDAEADRGEDPIAVFADRLAEFDERLEPAAGQARQEPVDQDRDVLEAEPGLEDRADCFLERVGARYLAACGLEPSERGGLLVGQVCRRFKQRPAGVLEALGGRRGR